MILRTPRLEVRLARESDAELYHALWSDPRVMGNVGFPRGLGLSVEEIRERIRRRSVGEGADREAGPFDRFLVVVRRVDGTAIGECSLHRPDEKGIARTDIKLRPAFWRQGFGVELKRALLDYQFRDPACVAVEASPNVDNLPSIRMQEAVGGERAGEAVYEFPEDMRDRTRPVHYYVYRVTRERWKSAAAGIRADVDP